MNKIKLIYIILISVFVGGLLIAGSYFIFFQKNTDNTTVDIDSIKARVAKEKTEACSDMATSTYKIESTGVYYKSEEDVCWEVERADPQTFEVLSYGFGKDVNRVFYKGDKRVPDRDVSTFVVLSDLYSKDKNDVFVRAYHDIEGEDAATFEVIDGSAYAKDKNFVYNSELVTEYGSNGVIKGADPQTFVLLGGGYTKDKNRVYLYGQTISDADSATAIKMDNECGLLKDSKHVFRKSSIILDALPESFADLSIESAPECTFFTDAKNVFLLQVGTYLEEFLTIKNVDRNSLRFVTTTHVQPGSQTLYSWPYFAFFDYFRHFITADKNRVFFNDASILGADPGTYQALNECYTKDKNHAYYGGLLPMQNVDLASFEIVSPQDRYTPCRAKDKNFLYIDEKPMLPNRDNPEFLSPLSFGKTSKNVYYMGKEIVGADPYSFKIVVREPNEKYSYYTSDIYSVDKQYVYYGEKRVFGADPATFKLSEGLGAYHAIDKNGKYLNGVKIKDDFKLCSTDPTLLPKSNTSWSEILGVDPSNTSTLKFEFCQMPDGGTLVGYKQAEKEAKTVKLFNNVQNKQGEFTLECSNTVPGNWGEGYYAPAQSFQALEGNKVILSCLTGDACESYTISEFDLNQLKRTPSGLTSKKVDGPFGCGYAG